MDLVVLPPPVPPVLTVRLLAKLLGMHPWEWTNELRDYKFPRAGGGKQRVPYYQQVLVALRGLIDDRGDVAVLARVVCDLKEKLAASEASGDIPNPLATKLRQNLRLLGHLSSFARVRDVEAVLSVKTRKVTVSEVEIRSTPDLVLQVGSEVKRVFLHKRDEACDEEEARRMLELAHWVELEGGARDAPAGDFELWVPAENRVLSWPSARKTTVKRALQSLPILLGAWDKVQPPKSWKPDEAAADSEG